MQLARRNLLKGGLLCSTAAGAAVAVPPASTKLVEKFRTTKRNVEKASKEKNYATRTTQFA